MQQQLYGLITRTIHILKCSVLLPHSIPQEITTALHIYHNITTAPHIYHNINDPLDVIVFTETCYSFMNNDFLQTTKIFEKAAIMMDTVKLKGVVPIYMSKISIN